MIERNEWVKLRGLMLTAKRLVDGLYAGGHASARRGVGVEFHDYRPYVPGDDLSQLDWKVYGRTDRHYLRRHQLETDLHLYLLVDCSASMNFAGLDKRGRSQTDGPPTKLEYARQFAAAVAMLAVGQSDRVALGLFDKTVHQWLGPASTWAHLQRLTATLEAVRPGVGAGDLGHSLAQAHRLIRRRGLVVILSDLLDEPAGLFDGLARFRHSRRDLAVFQLLTPQELDLRHLGKPRLQLVDAETREQTPTHVPVVAERYARLMRAHLEKVRRGCTGRGSAHELLLTTTPPVQALQQYLARRQTSPPC